MPASLDPTPVAQPDDPLMALSVRLHALEGARKDGELHVDYLQNILGKSLATCGGPSAPGRPSI